ncbi:MAG: hypothetical protein JST80_11020 [Bdellovibrionales bacterium]|nr:hypothetical protein [Bdellovibrionales bacterium]
MNFKNVALSGAIVGALLVGCSSSKPKTDAAAPAKTSAAKTASTLPFPFKNLASDQQMALKAYANGEACPSGAKVGATARDLQFVLPTLDEVEESMKTHECKKHIDVLKGLDGKAYTTKRGNTIPLWVWMCSDGTVVRVKPFGDPTSKFNRKPHGSVALRYPCDAKYETFDDEMFKFDANGNPIPKWARELDSKDPDTIETWAHAAHFPVIVTGKIKR